MKTHIFGVYLLVKSSRTRKLQEGNVITHSFWVVVRLMHNNFRHRELLFTLRCGRFVYSIKCPILLISEKNQKLKISKSNLIFVKSPLKKEKKESKLRLS